MLTKSQLCGWGNRIFFLKKSINPHLSIAFICFDYGLSQVTLRRNSIAPSLFLSAFVTDLFKVNLSVSLRHNTFLILKLPFMKVLVSRILINRSECGLDTGRRLFMQMWRWLMLLINFAVLVHHFIIYEKLIFPWSLSTFLLLIYLKTSVLTQVSRLVIFRNSFFLWNTAWMLDQIALHALMRLQSYTLIQHRYIIINEIIAVTEIICEMRTFLKHFMIRTGDIIFIFIILPI